MRATAAAASTQAAASLVRVRIIGLPVGATDGATPGAGARSLQHRVSYYAFTALRLEPEHHQRAAGVRHVRVVAERADRAQRRRRIFRPDAERHAGAGPATDPREHDDVLLAVRTAVGHRVADDARRTLEPPQLGPGRGIHGLEPAFHRAVEHDARGRGECTAIGREVFLDRPLDLPDGRIPGDEGAAVAARAREHPHDRAHIGLTGRVLHLNALVIHADVVGRDVEEVGLRRVRGGLLILEADGGRANPLSVLLRGGPELRVTNRDARREIDLRGPVDRPERLGAPAISTSAWGQEESASQTSCPVLTAYAVTRPRTRTSPPEIPAITMSLMTIGALGMVEPVL